MCIWGFVDTVSHLGVKYAKKTQKGAWIGMFKPNSQNIKTDMLSKLLCWSQPWLTNIKYSLWVIQTHIKNQRRRTAVDCYISAVDWPTTTKFGTMTRFDPLCPIPADNISNFLKIHNDGWPPFWKSKNGYLSATGWLIAMKFGNLAHIDPQGLCTA